MRYTLLFWMLAAFTTGLFAQEGVKFQKVAIGNSGAYAYMPGPCDPAVLEKSPDSSLVYTMNTVVDNFVFDVVLVKLNVYVAPQEVEPLLESYLDFLKTPLEIVSAAGYGKGHTLTTHPAAKGILDYWKDKDGNEVKVMGWADTQYIAVMIITGKTTPNLGVSDVFMKGIRFPGD